MSSSVYTEEDVVCQRSVYKGATQLFSDGLSPLAGICTTAFFASTADFLLRRATALPALHLFPSFQLAKSHWPRPGLEP
eukprot:3726711-Rhodomonas_salina.1